MNAEVATEGFSNEEAGLETCPYRNSASCWLKLELVDEYGVGLENVRYFVVLPDGSSRRGRLDARGQGSVQRVPEGECKVGFPDLDASTWAACSSAEGVSTLVLAEAEPPADLARPQFVHRVVPGDCISSIAEASGHFWQTIWEHPSNSSLRALRDDPNVLSPGDEVTVPALVYQEARCKAGGVFRFERKAARASLRLALRDGQQVPLANLDFLLEIDGVVTKGVLDSEGKLDEIIPADARVGALQVFDAQRAPIVDMNFGLGELDPIDTDTGVAQRLRHLGLCERSGPEELHDAVVHFQCRYLPDHPNPGDLDSQTRSQLAKVYRASAGE